MTAVARLTVDARREALGALLAFVDDVAAREALAAEEAMAVRLAVEEVCTNVITHGYQSAGGPLTVELTTAPGEIVVAVEDRGEPFDPAALPAPDVAASLDARTLGGLGWHLVKRLMDAVRHEPLAGGGNRVTLVKRRLAVTP